MVILYETVKGYELGIPNLEQFIRSGMLGKVITKYGSIKNQKKGLTRSSFSDFAEIHENDMTYFLRKKASVCPDCGSVIANIEGCQLCSCCGWSACC